MRLQLWLGARCQPVSCRRPAPETTYTESGASLVLWIRIRLGLEWCLVVLEFGCVGGANVENKKSEIRIAAILAIGRTDVYNDL